MAKKLEEVGRKPPATPEEYENECIALAFKEARRRLIDGTASSQLITEFIKAGSHKRELEMEELEKKNALLVAKVETLESQRRTEDIYKKALDAMRTYAGYEGNDDEF